MTDRNASNPDFPKLEWNESVKSYLLSSFFWGNVVTQVAIYSIYCAKYMLFFGVLMCSCLAQLTPFYAIVRLAIGLLTMAVPTNSATNLGFHVNHTDLAPNFAGTLMGITNCAANFLSILAPLIVRLIVWDERNPAQLRIVFFFTAFVYFMGNLLFMLFGRTGVQEWKLQQLKRC